MGEIVVACVRLEVSVQLEIPAVLIPEKLDKRMTVSLSFC